MSSQSPRSEREEERRLNVRTLAIASVASASAALVTSQLWIAGTWIAAAVTPVLVALIAELLTRPTERIGRVLASARTSPFPPAEDPAPRVSRAPEPDPQAPRRDSPRVRPDPHGVDPAGAPPVRVYRSRPGGRARGRRKLAVGMVAATAAAAFLIAVALITIPELIAGQSIGRPERATTLLGGQPRDQRDARDEGERRGRQAPATTAPEREGTTSAPTDAQPTETTTTPTETAPAPQAPAPQAAPPGTPTTPTTPTP